MNSNSVTECLKKGKIVLREAGIETWALDADLMMERASGFNRVELITKGDFVLSSEQMLLFENYINRRLKWEPVQYILNQCEFMGLDFYVDKNVLIPRGDTECVLQPAIDFINENKLKNALDLCTGSGCIAICLAYYCKGIENVISADISQKAIDIVRKNADLNNVSGKVRTILTDMFENMPKEYKVDIIISNPPYIRTKDIESLKENVKAYEPRLALDGGNDGLMFYAQIAEKAKYYLNEAGRIYLEIGSDQKTQVMALFEDYQFVESIKDLAGLDRGLVFSK